MQNIYQHIENISKNNTNPRHVLNNLYAVDLDSQATEDVS